MKIDKPKLPRRPEETHHWNQETWSVFFALIKSNNEQEQAIAELKEWQHGIDKYADDAIEGRKAEYPLTGIEKRVEALEKHRHIPSKSKDLTSPPVQYQDGQGDCDTEGGSTPDGMTDEDIAKLYVEKFGIPSPDTGVTILKCTKCGKQTTTRIKNIGAWTCTCGERYVLNKSETDSPDTERDEIDRLKERLANKISMYDSAREGLNETWRDKELLKAENERLSKALTDYKQSMVNTHLPATDAETYRLREQIKQVREIATWKDGPDCASLILAALNSD